MRKLRHRSTITTLALLLALGLSACGKPGDDLEITDTAMRSEHRAPVSTDASNRERFGVSGTQTAGAAQGPALHWKGPEGWKELAPTQYRKANFAIGADGEAECYITALPGDGGGEFANANRWREQLGLASYTDGEFSQLTRKPILGQQGIYVEFDGAYAGMSQEESKEGYRLMGVLARHENESVFVKMIGPSALLEAERANFEAFLQSLHYGEGHDHGDAPEAAEETQVASNLPAGHPTYDSLLGLEQPQVAPSRKSDGFEWQAPEGWNPGPEKSMRLANFLLGESNKTECYITVLGGDGGGLTMNLNRWLGQMGKDPMTEEELGSLPTITVLGEPVALLEAAGAFQGMTGGTQSNQALLGVARMLDGKSLFVKMTGPEADVLAHKEDFIAFCESIQSK